MKWQMCTKEQHQHMPKCTAGTLRFPSSFILGPVRICEQSVSSTERQKIAQGYTANSREGVSGKKEKKPKKQKTFSVLLTLFSILISFWELARKSLF